MKLSNASTLLQWIRVSSLGEPLSTSKSVLFRVTSWPCLVPQEPGVHLAPSNDWSSVSLKNYSKWEFIPQFERHQTIILWALDPNAIIYTHESYSLKHLSFSPSLGLTIIYHRTMMVHPWSPSVKQILAAKHLFHFECYHYCTLSQDMAGRMTASDLYREQTNHWRHPETMPDIYEMHDFA
jgi:hypothetical protein